MANGGEDHIHFEATFGELDADVARVKAILEEQLTKATALGDEALQARVRSQLAHPALGGAQDISRTTAALQRENEVLGQNLARQLEILDAMRLQATQADALATMNRRVASGPGIILPTGVTRSYSGAEQRIGSQVAAEAAAAEEQRRINELAAAEAVARAEALRVQEEQLAADKARGEALVEYQARLNAITRGNEAGFAAGSAAANLGRPLTGGQQQRLVEPPKGISGWEADYGKMALFNAELGKYDAYATKASVSTQYLSTNLTRLGIADAEASNQLRRHGALTTEFLGALARGETTVNEFGYQIGATIGKFAGWTAAATLTYGALGAVAEFGKGAIDASSGVQRLTRTIDGLDREKASQAIIGLSAGVNVPIKEAADAIFQYSRVFHNLDDATGAARLGLAAFKLDNVQVADSVKTSTSLYAQFGVGAHGLKAVYDELSSGQREYNARISQMIPLIGRAAGAVKNAGGDLTQLVQLGVYAQRTLPSLGGAQIGTAFYRSAATFLDPNTTKGQTDRGVLERLGINPNQGWTEVLRDALIKSVTLSGKDRSEVSRAIFGPNFGGRLSGLFSPETVPSFQQIAGLTGDPRKAITPQATQGSLNQELSRELGTAGERLHSFINEMQRTGAAIADSGIVNFFAALLGALVGVGGVVRSVISAFDGLPSAVKETVTGLVLLRSAMLFLNRTRFGASFGALSQAARIPGVDPAFEAQQARATLATGTRAAMQVIEDDIAKSTAASLTGGARQLSLERERAGIQAQIAAGEDKSGALVARSNALNEQIEALTRQQVVIEGEKNAQLEALAVLKTQQVGLTKTLRTDNRIGDEGAIALLAGTKNSATVTQASAEAATKDAAAQDRLAAWKGRMVRAYFGDAAATGAAGTAIAASGRAAGVAAGAAEEAAVEAEAAPSLFARFGTGMGGLAAAMDPIFVALLTLPFVFSAIKGAFDNAKRATDAATAAAREVPTTIAGLQQKARDLAAAAAKQKGTNATSTLPGPLGDIENAVLQGGQQLLGIWQNSKPTTKSLSSTQALVNIYQPRIDELKRDGELLVKTEAGRRKWLEELAYAAAHPPTSAPPVNVPGVFRSDSPFQLALRNAVSTANNAITPSRGFSRFDSAPALAKDFVDEFTRFTKALDAIKRVRADATGPQAYRNSLRLLAQSLVGKVVDAQKATGDFFDLLDRLTPAQLTTKVQGLSDRSGAFGLQGNELKQAGEAYLFLAARFRNSTDSKGLQLVQTAQSAFVNSVNKNVQDMLKASESATTFSGQSTNLNAAVGRIQGLRAQVAQWVAQMSKKFHAFPAIIKAVSRAAQQLDSQFNDQLKSALDQQIQLIEQNASLSAAQIKGFSPEADIARAQATLSGLQQALAKAQSEGASWSVVAGLLTQIDSAMNDIAKQRIDNARAILQAQGQLATSAITGVSPADDLARARQDLSNAQRLLSFDRSHGSGQAQILQDQAAVNDAQRAINEQIKSNAQQQAQQVHQDLAALIQSQTSLQQSLTNDPVQQAREQLAGDLQVLSTIHRSDYKSQQEFQTAINEAQAKINNDRKAIVQQVHQDLVALIQSQTDLQESRTSDPVKQAREQLAGDIRLLSTIHSSDYNNPQEFQTAINEAQTKINNDRKALQQQIFQTDLRNLQFEHTIQRITDQQYLQGLRQILRTKKLTIEERQQILTEIFNASQQAAVNLNTDQIKLPTTYEVRRAILSAARRGRGGPGGSGSDPGGAYSTTNNTNNSRVVNNINLHVTRDTDMRKVAKVLDDTLKTNLTTSAQAAQLV